MSESTTGLSLSSSTPVARNEEEHSVHIPSTIQADTLFNFTTKIEYLVESLRRKKLFPRYNVEDISYLHISNIDKIAILMKCFCDINLHRLDIHLNWYGHYGLAFSKEWGMKQAIQPVHYINQSSRLCADFSEAFCAALTAKRENESPEQITMKNYLLHNLMYLKPYEGNFKNQEGKIEKKCFTDECEWRFIPNVDPLLNLSPFYFDEKMLNSDSLVRLSNALKNDSNFGLSFSYEDLKYIIIKNDRDFSLLAKTITVMNISALEKHQLFSKIIIWEKSRGDF